MSISPNTSSKNQFGNQILFFVPKKPLDLNNIFKLKEAAI